MSSSIESLSSINRRNELFVKFYNEGSIDNLISLFSEKAQIFLPGIDVIEGKASIGKAFCYMKKMIASIDNQTIELNVYGDVAIEVGRYKHQCKDGNIVDTGKYLVCWRKLTDSWVIDKDSLSTSQKNA